MRSQLRRQETTTAYGPRPTPYITEAIQRRIVWLVVGPHAIQETLKPLVERVNAAQTPEIVEATRLAVEMSETVSELYQLLPEEFLPTTETLLGLGWDAEINEM